MISLHAFLNSHLLQTKIESNYISGVPKFTVLDFGPSYSKEISLKMRSALSSTGFLWRLKKQALFSFDINFINMKKNTEIELSFFIKYLLDSGQINLKTHKKIVACGEVNLHGKVKSFDLEKINPRSDEIWIGNFKDPLGSNNLISIECISDLRSLDLSKASLSVQERIKVKLSFVDLVSLYGKHSVLNLNKKIISIKDKGREIFHFHQVFGSGSTLKELVQINHTNTFTEIKALMSGNNNKLVLVEDYSLLEDRIKKILLHSSEKLLLIADTSLCPCGKAELNKPKKCGFSLHRCRSSIEKMSASGLSNYDIFLHTIDDYKLLNDDECLRVWDRALEISKKRSEGDYDKNNIESLKSQIEPKYKNVAYLPKSLGEERLKKLLRIARDISDLRGREKIAKEDLDLALNYGFYPLKELVSLF